MQKYMYEKAMAQETRNGGASTLNNSGVGTGKKKVLVVLDIFCLLLGESESARLFPLLYEVTGITFLWKQQIRDGF